MKCFGLLLCATASAAAAERKIISTPNAPGAIGPYSQAVMMTTSGGPASVYVAGQIGLDPATGEMVTGGITNETRRAMENVKAILTAAGANITDVAECTVLLADFAEYAAFNEVYATYFEADAAPARAAYQVVALPKNARTEVKCTAVF